MRTLTKKQVWEMAIAILRIKMTVTGVMLKEDEFTEFVTKMSRSGKCGIDEFREFYAKFIYPSIQYQCKLASAPPLRRPGFSPREGEIALSILSERFFWDARGLRDDIQGLSNKLSCGVAFEDVAAVALKIHNEHVWSQFGEGPEELELKIVDNETGG